MGIPHIILIGGGGHAKVVLDTARCAHRPVTGFVDDHPRAPLISSSGPPRDQSLQYLGSIDSFQSNTETKSESLPILAIGDLQIRADLIESFQEMKYAQPLIHPSAIISKSTQLAQGVFVAPGAIINPDVSIGKHAIINTGSIIEHDCTIGINTHIAPRAVFGGNVSIGDHTLIGIGAVVLPGIRIGNHCIIGAGAIVTKDIEDSDTVVGNPARSLNARLNRSF